MWCIVYDMRWYHVHHCSTAPVWPSQLTHNMVKVLCVNITSSHSTYHPTTLVSWSPRGIHLEATAPTIIISCIIGQSLTCVYTVCAVCIVYHCIGGRILQSVIFNDKLKCWWWMMNVMAIMFPQTNSSVTPTSFSLLIQYQLKSNRYSPLHLNIYTVCWSLWHVIIT